MKLQVTPLAEDPLEKQRTERETETTPVKAPHAVCAFCGLDIPIVFERDAWRWTFHREGVQTESMGVMPGESCPGSLRPVAQPVRKR